MVVSPPQRTAEPGLDVGGVSGLSFTSVFTLIAADDLVVAAVGEVTAIVTA